jgi:hypothetical protein
MEKSEIEELLIRHPDTSDTGKQWIHVKKYQLYTCYESGFDSCLYWALTLVLLGTDMDYKDFAEYVSGVPD